MSDRQAGWRIMEGVRVRLPTAPRSRIMSAIRGRGNETTELRLASILRREGLKGWRRHVKLMGSPDFFWKDRQIAVFVDGCFWHGCPHCYLPPRRNATFWRNKIVRNKSRDRKVTRRLRQQGIRV